MEVDHNQQVNQQDGERQSAQQADIGRFHGFALSAQDELRTARQFGLVIADNLFNLARHCAQVGSIHVGIDIDDRLHVVVAYRAQLRAWGDGGQVA